MASSGSVFSQTLQEITNTKLEELAKKRGLFEKQKATAIAAADSKKDALDMLTALADGVKKCFSLTVKDGKVVRANNGHPRLVVALQNLDRFIDQARFDPSISSDIVAQWKNTLLRYLETQSLKHQYADLYGKMTVEWLTSSIPKTKATEVDAMDVSDDFEELSTRAKIESRKEWEERVFVEASVDRSAITDFLNQLFDTKESKKALQQLRKEVSSMEYHLRADKQFGLTTLSWIIKGLLASDLLSNEKRQVLRDFEHNTVILMELADVLNMRMSGLKNWSWGNEVNVEQRRQLNGIYNIYMHEDLLQAIFLQYIGVQWSVKIKASFKNILNNRDVWKSGHQELSPLQKQRRSWYLPTPSYGSTVQQIRSACYEQGFFVSQLLDTVNQDTSVDEGDEEAYLEVQDIAPQSKQARQSAPVQQMAQTTRRPLASRATPVPPQPSTMRFGKRTEAVVKEDGDDADEDMGFGLFNHIDMSVYKPKNPMDAKRRLLHLLSTELLVKTRIDGEFCCFRSQFQQWNPSLPHATVCTILSFFGFSNKWITFFTTFLQAPLKFLGEDDKARLRRRGTPGAHALSDFFGEVVLFCLDFAINQSTNGERLWRLYDDFWFWSADAKTCVEAWKTIEKFNTITGMTLNETKSGAVRIVRSGGQLSSAKLDKSLPDGDIRWGMIYLDGNTGKFTIDRRMVDKHIEELRRQLKDKERSIFAWVQAYSTYASVFFTSNFGKPANCFGREHLDAMLSSHERIQKTLFSGKDGTITSVVDWLKKQIEERFGVKNVPDGYLFFPTELGGLDVKSPFINLLQIRDSVAKDPDELLNRFEESERDAYAAAKKKYLEKKPWLYATRTGRYRPDQPQEFMSFDEYIKFREEIRYEYSDQLAAKYELLLQQPQEDPIDVAEQNVFEALDRIKVIAPIKSWYSMDPYWKWVAMLYGPEMLTMFNGFEIVDAGLLPMGMVGLFRSGRVSWQE